MEKHKTLALTIATIMGILIIFNSSCKKTDDKPDETATITDIEGNVYQTVKIGDQLWMAENLKVTKYNDGTDIPLLKSGSISDTLNGKPVGYRFQYNDKEDIGEYGEHYTWYVVSSQHLCPAGWHVPDTTEWMAMFNHLGGIEVAGGKMKSILGWVEPNNGATNSSGFNGMGAGTEFYSDWLGYTGIRYVDTLGWWWSSVSKNYEDAYMFLLRNNWINVYLGSTFKKIGGSVRCIKD
jgi:uncharacterized protein (TIGR02145 family)